MGAITRIHHIDFVVKDLDAAISRYEQLFGIVFTNRVSFPSRDIEAAYFRLEGVIVALVCPQTRDGPVGRYLDEHGEGFFHIAYQVDDLSDCLEQLASCGVAVSERRIGLEGWSLAEIDREKTFGVLSQLVEAR